MQGPCNLLRVHVVNLETWAIVEVCPTIVWDRKHATNPSFSEPYNDK